MEDDDDTGDYETGGKSIKKQKQAPAAPIGLNQGEWEALARETAQNKVNLEKEMGAEHDLRLLKGLLVRYNQAGRFTKKEENSFVSLLRTIFEDMTKTVNCIVTTLYGSGDDIIRGWKADIIDCTEGQKISQQDMGCCNGGTPTG